MAKQFPGTLLEFEHWFRTEQACREFLACLRWPDGFRCPRCSHRKGWRSERGLYRCAKCDLATSATSGTIFHDTRLPLRLWFRAAWWITNQKGGVSALGLQRLLGLGSYRTAWMCLHKLRRAMVRPSRELLSGRVEVDETLVGGRKKGAHSRHEKTMVSIAAEIRSKGTGRIRLRRIPDDREASIKAFVQSVIAPGSELVTDGAHAYKALIPYGYLHDRTVMLGKDEKALARALPRVHRIASLLKRWLLGVHQGRPSPSQLDHYLEEFAFRFNRRSSPKRGMLFFRLLQQCVVLHPTPYRKIRHAT